MEQLFFDMHPSAMLICDLESHQILQVNDAFSALYGYNSDEIEEKELILADISSSQNADKTGIFGKGILCHKAKSGERLHVKVNCRDFTYKGRKACLMAITDFTEEYQKIEELRENEALFKRLFTNAPQAIVMVDAQNRVQQVNNSFEDLFGYSADELLGRDLNRVIESGEGYDEAPKVSQEAFQKSEIYPELKRFTKHGEELNLLVGGIPVHLDNELIAGFGIYIDITKQKETEKKLKQSLNEKQVLLAEVHHRVKNNLAVVSGLLEMQTMHVEDKRLTKYIQNSQMRIKSMAIVHEMLYQSKTLSQVQMDDYVRKLARVISNTLSPGDKVISTSVQSEPIMLNVNQSIPSALIITELITNAYEYAFEGRQQGKLTVSIDKEGNKITVAVQDNGIGLPEEFETMRKKSLGLSLIETLCAQLKTEIEIESGDWGTRFAFTFHKKEVSGSSSSGRVHNIDAEV